jgi:integrase
MKPNTQKAKEEKSGLIRVGQCLYRYENPGKPTHGTYYFQGQINKTRRTQSLGTTDYATARRELIKRRALLGDEHYSSVKISLADWCERYRRTFQDQKPNTVADKNRVVDRIIADWPTGRNTPIDKILPSDCNLWLSQYDFGIPTRNGYIWMLKDLFKMAVRDRLLPASPAEHLKTQKRKSPLRLTPTFEQFEQIVASVRSHPRAIYNGHGADDSADFLEAQGLLGLGQAELSSMTRQDVDLERNQISVERRKTGKRFVIPIYPQARALIEKACRNKRHNQKIFAIGNAKKALKAACERLDFPLFSQRSFRRMFVTRAIEKGVDVKVIAEWQGYQDGGKLIADTYSHVQRPHAHRMAQLMA